MITRRTVLRGLAAAVASGVALPAYAFGIEPWRLTVANYRLTPPNWPPGLELKIAALADIHACEPWMSAARIAQIVARTNALSPDIVVLLGDYSVSTHYYTRLVHSQEWAAVLSHLRAPLGVHAVMGNHDWWEDRTAQRDGRGPTFGHRALAKVGIAVYENEAARLVKDGRAFWIAGLGDQIAFVRRPPNSGYRQRWGVDDLPGTLARVTGDAPVILLAHEPDIFHRVPDRVALTLSGHTHGGQVSVFGYRPIVPSRYGRRYAYGHVVEGGRNLIVSGGLGCSVAPIRFGVPPEIVVIEVGA